MKGFSRREWYLLRPNAFFYGGFLAFFLVVCFFSQKAASFFPVYLLAFGNSSVLALFTYDETNGWRAYAAALPGGRRTMVDARYVTGLAIALVTAVVSALSTAMAGDGVELWFMSIYGSATLLSLAISIPITYRFGGIRARLATLVLFCALAGGITAMALADSRGGLSTGLAPSGGIAAPWVPGPLRPVLAGVPEYHAEKGVLSDDRFFEAGFLSHQRNIEILYPLYRLACPFCYL